MSKKQIEKDFKELIPGGNSKSRIEEYYKSKKKEMLLLLVAGLFLLAVSLYSDFRAGVPKENRLIRNKYGEGKKEVSLEVKVNEDNWESVSVILEEKEYTREEIIQMYEVALKNLPQIIKKENETLEMITSDLDLVTALEEYPFQISWRSSNPEVLDEDGKIYFENISRIENVDLTVTLQYGEWEKEDRISVTVQPKNKEDYIFYLMQNLKEEESKTRKEENFLLPDSYQEHLLQWRYPASNATLVLTILFIIIVPFISYQKDVEIHRQIIKRREELLDSFPEFISQLILYMEAGMSVRGAMFRILQEGQRKKHDSYLYKELAYVARQMKNGLPEKEGYELLAIRCNLSCYRKLSNLLAQHIQKGSSTILENLRKEAAKAVEEQKGRIQKRGEEMGTKLLFPMMIMLLIVMVFIMVPALFSFQM